MKPDNIPSSSNVGDKQASSIGDGVDVVCDLTPVADESVDVDSDESLQSENGTKYWIPCCPQELKPCVGMRFECLEDASKFYYAYGARCRFDIRSGSSKPNKDGTLKSKQWYCNREGFHKATPTYDNCKDKIKAVKRRTASFRIGCKAAIAVKSRGAVGYIVSEFVERHNHKLSSPESSQFLKHRRRIKTAHQRFIVQVGKANVGPVEAHKLSKQLAGSFANVGAQVNEFRNYHRDVIAYIGDDDAQMVVDKLQKKQALFKSFKFDFSVSEGTLTRIFWADSISQLNFHAFGDVVTFDATYSLNKYNMIFVPFTGVDNHMKSITFAAALISSEDQESYTWILEQFLECMGRAPLVVLTDQDPALRVVIPKIMPDTHHRFCIWHIMKKLSAKVGFNTPILQEFRKKLKSIVYDYHVETHEFEENWNKLIIEYDMLENRWLSDMFGIRNLWVPAYFRDIPLGGLLRTTSRSESANSFFGGFLNHRLTLLGFFMGFDSALETQRHTQAMLDNETRSKVSTLETPLPIELDAHNIYTRSVFLNVQTEIAASCYQISVFTVSQCETGAVYEFKDPRYKSVTFQVSEDRTSELFECSCKLHRRVGYICRHVFVVLRSLAIHQIPRRYVLNRWTRDAVIVAAESVNPMLREDWKIMKQVAAVQSDIYADFEACVQLAGDNAEKREYIMSNLKQMRSHLQDANEVDPIRSKQSMISEIIGAQKPTVVTVKNPAVVHTKGSGKRLISEREQAVQRQDRPLRQCRTCGLMSQHDSRNCPSNNAA